jgi:integrase
MGLFKKHGSYYIDYYLEGRRVREKIGPSKRQAERALAVRRGEVLQGRLKLADRHPSPRFDEFAVQYLEYSQANKRSARRDRFMMKQLLAAFGMRRLKEITPWRIEEYKAKRRRERAPASVNLELACLKHMFSMAITWGKAESNPVKQVKFFRLDNQVERILTSEEEARLLAAANARLRPVLILALNTGMRLGECLSLRWNEIDFVRGALHVAHTKSGKSRNIPMNRAVVETLRGLQRAGSLDGPIFQADGKPIRSIQEAFNRARARTDLKDVRFHDLRHTFATRLVTAGVDIVTVSKLLGHSTLAMTLRYAHPAPEDLRRAVQLLPNRHDACTMEGQYLEQSPVQEYDLAREHSSTSPRSSGRKR